MGTTSVNPASAPVGVSAPAQGHGGHNGAAGPSSAGSPSFSGAYAQALARSAPAGGLSATAVSRAVSGNIPVGNAGHGGGHDLHLAALALRGKRLELLASNIVNADTPGYKAVDIDVEEALRSGVTAATVPVKYRIPMQPSMDGNTVEMEVERAQFADAAVRYEFSLNQALKHYMHISDLFRDLKD